MVVTMEAVVSSNIAEIGYDNGYLYVRFNSGKLYRYSGVPVSAWNALRSAPSKGTYLNASIKPGYPYVELDANGEPLAAGTTTPLPLLWMQAIKPAARRPAIF